MEVGVEGGKGKGVYAILATAFVLSVWACYESPFLFILVIGVNELHLYLIVLVSPYEETEKIEVVVFGGLSSAWSLKVQGSTSQDSL